MFAAVTDLPRTLAFYLFVNSCCVCFRCSFPCLRSSSFLRLVIVVALLPFLLFLYVFTAIFASSALRGCCLFVRSCFASFRCQFPCLRSSSFHWLFIVPALRLFLPSVVCFSSCGSVFGILFAIFFFFFSCGVVFGFLFEIFFFFFLWRRLWLFCLRSSSSSSFCGVVFGFSFEISFSLRLVIVAALRFWFASSLLRLHRGGARSHTAVVVARAPSFVGRGCS